MLNRTPLIRSIVQMTLIICLALIITATLNIMVITPLIAKGEFLSFLTNKSYCVDTSIKESFDHLYRDINQFALDPAIVNVSNQIKVFSQNQNDMPMAPSKGSAEERYLYSRFSNYATTHPNVVYVYLATQYGGYLTWPETNIPALYNPTKRTWYQTALGGQGRIETTEPYIDLVTSKTIISNAVAFYSNSGEVKGVVGIDVEISGMIASTQLKEDQNYQQKDLQSKSTLYLVHRSGTILHDVNAPQNNMLNLANVDEDLWKDFNAAINPLNKEGKPSSAPQLVKSHGPKNRYLGIAPVGSDENDWWFIVATNKKDLNDLLKPTLNKVNTLVGSLILLTSLLVALLYHLSRLLMV